MTEFLHQKAVEFTDKDIRTDDQAMEELTRLGYSATPVIVIDGEVVVGFNRVRLEQLLSPTGGP